MDAYHIIFIILILIFVRHGILNYPFSCKHTILSIAYRNLVHNNIFHILINLYSLYVLSRIERQIGFQKFLQLVSVIFILATLMEYILSKQIYVNCSIGFSGILFGLLAWEMITERDIDLKLIAMLTFIVVRPNLMSRRASLVGHSVGAISGAIVGLLWKNNFLKF